MYLQPEAQVGIKSPDINSFFTDLLLLMILLQISLRSSRPSGSYAGEMVGHHHHHHHHLHHNIVVVGNFTTTLPSYSDRCILFNLDTLESRRTKVCVACISNLLRGNVDTPDLLSQLCWYVRNRTALAITFRNTTFGTNDQCLICLLSI